MHPGLDLPIGTIWWIECGFAARAAELGRPVPEVPAVAELPSTALAPGVEEIALPLGRQTWEHELHLVVAVGPELKMAPGLVFTATGRSVFGAIGEFVPQQYGVRAALTVDGTLRQETDPAAMLWGVERLIDFLLRKHGLQAGDLVFTGTPAGVGPVRTGDRLTATLADGSCPLHVRAD